MRTLILLIALLLLALQTQAEPLPGRAEEVLDQEQLGEDEQGVSIFLGGRDSTALQDAEEEAVIFQNDFLASAGTAVTLSTDSVAADN
ncbi:hypothetical protein ACRRTK_012950 [Alexandromys fortis]